MPAWDLPLAHPTAHLPHPAPGAAAAALLEVLCLLQGECLSWLPQLRELDMAKTMTNFQNSPRLQYGQICRECPCGIHLFAVANMS